mmetsp:Transcript_5173/g.10780  ORF Transcript_5173/g.10780 Transcript_5173/m.10780 type:complete len:98 (-) Transcript_5173:3443-3736(-)
MMTYQQVLVISLHKEKTRFKKKLRLSSTRDQVYSQRITTCGLLVTPLRSSLQSFESLKISDLSLFLLGNRNNQRPNVITNLLIVCNMRSIAKRECSR